MKSMEFEIVQVANGWWVIHHPPGQHRQAYNNKTMWVFKTEQELGEWLMGGIQKVVKEKDSNGSH